MGSIKRDRIVAWVDKYDEDGCICDLERMGFNRVSSLDIEKVPTKLKSGWNTLIRDWKAFEILCYKSQTTDILETLLKVSPYGGGYYKMTLNGKELDV